MQVSDFNKFLTNNGEVSTYKNVPISLLDEFRKVFGFGTFRIRYRGKRVAFRWLDGRTYSQSKQDCIKIRADRFSAYCVNYTKYNKLLKEVKMNKQVIIDGVEYIAKTETSDIRFLNDMLNDKISELQSENNYLSKKNEELTDDNNEQGCEVDELRDEVSRLTDIIDDIKYTLNRNF